MINEDFESLKTFILTDEDLVRHPVIIEAPWNKGIPHTEETKAAISAKTRGKKRKPLSKEHKEKLSKSAMGKSTEWLIGKKRIPHSQETKRKMAEARRLFWKNKQK